MNGGEFRAAQAAGWTAVSLPYRGGKLAMVALLPPRAAAAARCRRRRAGRDDRGRWLDGQAGLALAGGRARRPVAAVALPRVNLSTQAT